MSVSHALISAVSGTDEQVPGLLEVLAQVSDPRRERGRRFTLVFVLAVAVVCVLAGAKSFREIGDQAGDLPQGLLARLGGKPHPLRRRIIAPSEKRIRTLLQDRRGGAGRDHRGLAAGLAAAGRLEQLADRDRDRRQMAARCRRRRRSSCSPRCCTRRSVIIAQHAIPEDTNEITQVRELLEPVDLAGQS